MIKLCLMLVLEAAIPLGGKFRGKHEQYEAELACFPGQCSVESGKRQTTVSANRFDRGTHNWNVRLGTVLLPLPLVTA